jgi:hypothetical protein
MRRKVVAVWISFALITSMLIIVNISLNFTQDVSATTRFVNETGTGGAFTSIQDAINASFDGDTVFVYNGTYYENVIVNKTINLIGENRDNTTINGSGAGDVVAVSVDFVNITGFIVLAVIFYVVKAKRLMYDINWKIKLYGRNINA